MSTVFDKLQFNSKNPRKIGKKELSRLKEKIRKFPQMLEKRPIVYDENFIVLGGNQRLKILRELAKEGFEIKESYFTSTENWSEEQKLNFIINDNISDGGWDYDLLSKEEWGNLPLEEWGIPRNTWNPSIVEDEAPKIDSYKTISKLGEVYQLGKHRLMCADSTKIEDVLVLMNDHKADMVFTDPPYNVDYEGKTRDALKIKNDKQTANNFYQFLYDAFVNLNSVSKLGASIYICHADTERVNFTSAFQDSGWKLAQIIIWVKDHFVMGRQDYQWQHEPILYGWKEGQSHYFIKNRTLTTLWNIDRPISSREHPTMKPLKLIANALHNSSKSGSIILDVFGGSGSTLIACEQINRTCFMMELDPKYCDVIRKRYANFISKGDIWEKITQKIN